MAFADGIIMEDLIPERSQDIRHTRECACVFTVEGLAKYSSDNKELYYYIVESQVSGYQTPGYLTTSGEGLIFNQGETAHAVNGQIVVNTPEGGYDLPATGGPGTRLFTILGSILVLGAGVLLWRRRRLM